MSLSRLLSIPKTSQVFHRLHPIRSASTFKSQFNEKVSNLKETIYKFTQNPVQDPPPSSSKLPGDPKGHNQYIHAWKGLNRHNKDDSFWGLLVSQPFKGKEPFLFAFYALLGFVGAIMVLTAFYSFRKIDVWSTHKNPPWEWPRSRDGAYTKYHILAYDPSHAMHRTLPTLEKIKDEMYKEAKKRETR